MREKKQNRGLCSRRIFSAILALFIVLSGCMAYPGEVSAQEKTAVTKRYGDYKYRYSETYRGIELVKYKGKASVVNIPSQIEGKAVTAIGANCFVGKNITQISMPDTVLVIGDWAFGSCNKLREIKLSENLQEICPAAFDSCYALKSLELPGKLQTIGRHAFSLCTALESIRVPDSVKEIGSECFDCNSALKKVVLPKNMKKIPDMMFYECTSLKSIDLPDHITVIGTGAFERCEALERIEIPASVEEIGNYAFVRCFHLKKLTFAKNSKLKKLGQRVFESCGLHTITLPAKLETLGEEAFAQSYFETIHFSPNCKVKKIPDKCFMGCGSLKEIDIPKNVTTIGKDLTVSGWDLDYDTVKTNKLAKINIMGGKIKTIGEDAFANIKADAVFSVPAKYKAKYTKLLKKQPWFQPSMKIS